MILLITGASHTGKTFLAQKFLEKYHYPYYSIDHLKMGLIRAKYTNLSVEDDDLLTNYLWPFIREMIKTAIENHQNLIFVGCYVPFNWRSELSEQYLSEIRFICLAMTEDYIRSNFDLIIHQESIIESRIYDSTFTSEYLIKENQKYIEGFTNHKEDIILISEQFDSSIKRLLEMN